MSDRLADLAQRDPEAFEQAAQELKGRIFVPHAGGQRAVLNSYARFRILVAGRRWGKTKVAAREVIRASRKPKQMIWWIANEYKNVRRGYREVVRQLPPGMLAKPAPMSTSNELLLQFKNGTIMEFYSGGNPDALAGEGVDFLVVDEGALIADQVWYQLLRPTLMDNRGRALILSTPRGHNWFWKLYQRGQETKDNGYESWRFPQTSNPYIAAEETEDARLSLPDIIFRQEIMAEFLASGASIFGAGVNRDGTVLDMLEIPRGQVYMGIDLAKQEDFTVISASRADDRRPVYHEKFNSISWPEQRRRIHDAYEELEGSPGVESVTVLLDSTGVGDVIYDDLTDEGLDCVPQKFTNQWKEAAVKLLAADLEQGRAFILEDQREEFESYEFTITDAGKYRFEAATGHDDEVSAKLLEHWGLNHEGPPNVSVVEGDREDEVGKQATVFQKNEPAPPATPLEIMNRAEAWH